MNVSALGLQIVGSCDSTTFDNEEGIITTPNYPNPYPIDKTCDWDLKGPKGMRIELKFENFELEYCHDLSFRTFEHNDHLAIYDGKTSKSNRIGDLLCGSKIPSNIISTSNNVHLEWKSDLLGGFKGFKIKASMLGKLSNIFTEMN